MNQAPRTLSYNPAENAVLLTSDVDGGSYELYKIPKDARGDSAPVSSLAGLFRVTVHTNTAIFELFVYPVSAHLLQASQASSSAGLRGSSRL